MITGANGFVGSTLSETLARLNHQVIACSRHKQVQETGFEQVHIPFLNRETVWQPFLGSIDAVIHLAARVHVMHDTSVNPLAEFQEVNLHGTINLVRQAAAAGVRRFVYVSSIKVNGESTTDAAFTESDIAAPQDPYAISKWQAEQALHEISRETGMEIVIVRPPLVYGPGVKANFLSLLKLVDKALPLPLGKVDNRRSMVFVGNLVDALITCALHPAAAGKTYLVSDGEDVSTPALIRQLAYALNRPCRLLPVPLSWLRFMAGVVGRTAVIERLTESLMIDSSRIRRDLQWVPPYSLKQGLQATADWFRSN